MQILFDFPTYLTILGFAITFGFAYGYLLEGWGFGIALCILFAVAWSLVWLALPIVSLLWS